MDCDQLGVVEEFYTGVVEGSCGRNPRSSSCGKGGNWTKRQGSPLIRIHDMEFKL